MVREIASPTLPAFVTACLQIVKAVTANKANGPPLRLIETIANALCTLTPLYPTTLRPFSSQAKTAFRVYVAPTASDKVVAPRTLQDASRRLFSLQHYTTPKNGNAEEWAKAVEGLVRTSHATADQVFRAVQESWESTGGYNKQSVSYEDEPHGGSDSVEALPLWNSLSSGAQRLSGLLETLAEFIKAPTKTPVVTPISAIMDLTARMSLIVPPQKSARVQDGTQLNTAVGREEKDELWSILPDIHIAVMDLLTTLIHRLQDSALSIAADMLHQTVRVFDAHQHIPLIRERGYVLTRELLLLHGPTMPKLSVTSLDKTTQACCRDLLAASGHAGPQQPTSKDTKAAANKSAPSKISSNADAYLKTQTKSSTASNTSSTGLPATHLAAASALLSVLLSHVPQNYLAQALRALLDRTAVLSHDKDALVASVLNPYRTRTGKMLASVLPFLVRDFPRAQEVEVLRSNLRTNGAAEVTVAGEGEDDDEAVLARMQRGGENEDEEDEEGSLGPSTEGEKDVADEDMSHEEPAAAAGFNFESVQQPVSSVVVQNQQVVTETGSGVVKQTVMLSTTLKRKSEELEEPPAKRLDTGKAPETVSNGMDVDGSDDEDDESVQLNAALEDDDSEEDDE